MDLTVLATPGYFATMAAEHAYLRRRAERTGAPARSDYEGRDTVTSLTMAIASITAPVIVPKLVAPFVPGKGRFGKVLVGTALGAIAVTVAADFVAKRTARDKPEVAERAQQVAGVGAVAAVATGGLAITTALASFTAPSRLWSRRIGRDLGSGPLALAVAILGWDFIYYWNHRLQHEARYMWAIHVVHHSSERYNLSTALRQPVGEVLGTYVPYGVMSYLGVRPALVETARALNLLYQYWIHTDAIRRLGPFEKVLNTPSHHRVHHGSNPEYIDRNHGSILIIWDRLFGTYEREDAPVVYGLTTNIDTFNPARVMGREHASMLRDVRESTTWKDRLSHVFRGPGWSYRWRAERVAARTLPADEPVTSGIS